MRLLVGVSGGECWRKSRAYTRVSCTRREAEVAALAPHRTGESFLPGTDIAAPQWFPRVVFSVNQDRFLQMPWMPLVGAEDHHHLLSFYLASGFSDC